MGLSRKELFLKIGVIDEPGAPKLHRRTNWAYHQLEQSRVVKKRFKSSFWAGSFPAGDKLHCGRQQVYGMLNLPQGENYASPKLVAASRAGTDAENQITYRWGRAGITIGGSVPIEEGDRFEQLRLQDPEFWLSGAIDGALDLRPEHPAVVCVDVKTKYQRVIDQIKVGAVGPDPRHVGQVISNIHLCRIWHEEMGWAAMGLEPCNGGFVYYVSRDDPTQGRAFWVPYEPNETLEALALLKVWGETFRRDEIPERPKNFKWSEEPCKWCPLKKEICKPDWKDGITSLSESHAVKFGKLDPAWDPKKIKQEVLDRWAGDTSTTAKSAVTEGGVTESDVQK